MYTQATHRAAAPAQSHRPLLRRLLELLVTQEAAFRARHRLERLEPHLLRDIGLTADEAEAAAKAPEWDAPAHWKR